MRQTHLNSLCYFWASGVIAVALAQSQAQANPNRPYPEWSCASQPVDRPMPWPASFQTGYARCSGKPSLWQSRGGGAGGIIDKKAGPRPPTLTATPSSSTQPRRSPPAGPCTAGIGHDPLKARACQRVTEAPNIVLPPLSFR